MGERQQGAFAAGKHGLACDMEDSPVNEVDLGPLGNDQPIGNTLHFVLPQRDVRAFIYDHDGDGELSDGDTLVDLTTAGGGFSNISTSGFLLTLDGAAGGDEFNFTLDQGDLSL